MTNPNQHNRHVEILLSMGITPHTQHHNYTYIYNSALTAMQRAVEESTTPKNESELLAFMLVNIQRMSDEKREFFIKDLFARYPELNPLRSELERVKSLLERASWLVGNPATNISSSTDLACESWQRDYKTLEGGGDE